MPVTFSLSPCVRSPHQLTELLALGSVHLMGENSLIKKGVRGAELWECSIGWSVQPAPPHLPNCSCLSMEKKNPLNSRYFAQPVTDTVVIHFSSNKSVSIRNSMQEQDRPLQHRPLQAPGSMEKPAIFIPYCFHDSSERCCTGRGSPLECKCGQRKV